MPNLEGGSWVDMFGLVMLIRLLGPLFHLPPMNPSEAGTWAATITAFAYSNTQGPKNG